MAKIALQDDFDPNSLVKVDDHQKLSSRVDDIERPEWFSDSFCNAASESLKLRKCIDSVIVELVQKDERFRETIRSLIRETDWRTFVSVASKIGFVVWTFVVLVVGALLQAWFSHIMPK
jgi:hypothetical protein